VELVVLLMQFLGLAGVIVVAGTVLTKYADALGELTGLGRSLAGLVLLAAATSLPELAVDCSAALIDAPDLAVGDLMGSCLFNLMILAVLDLMHHPRGRMLSNVAAAYSLSAAMSLMLVAIALLGIVAGSLGFQFEWFGVGPGTLAIGTAYVLALRLVYFDQQYVAEAVSVVEPPEEHEAESMTMRRAVTGYVIATGIIFAAAPFLARTADHLAAVSGLGGTFIGTTFVAVATSLPEVVTTFTAVRMGAFDLAVGNIVGSNSFNMAILVAVDLFYEGPLLASVSPTHALTAGVVIVISSVMILGLLYRVEKRYWILEPDAALVLLLGLGGLGLVYFAETSPPAVEGRATDAIKRVEAVGDAEAGPPIGPRSGDEAQDADGPP